MYSCSVPSFYPANQANKVMGGYQNQCCCCTGGGGTSYVDGDVQAYNDNQNPMFNILIPGSSPPNTVTGTAIDQGKGWCEQVRSGNQLLQVRVL